MDWFLYDKGLCQERVNPFRISLVLLYKSLNVSFLIYFFLVLFPDTQNFHPQIFAVRGYYFHKDNIFFSKASTYFYCL